MLIASGNIVVNTEHMIGFRTELNKNKSCSIIFNCMNNIQYTITYDSDKSAVLTSMRILQSYDEGKKICYCDDSLLYEGEEQC